MHMQAFALIEQFRKLPNWTVDDRGVSAEFDVPQSFRLHGRICFWHTQSARFQLWGRSETLMTEESRAFIKDVAGYVFEYGVTITIEEPNGIHVEQDWKFHDDEEDVEKNFLRFKARLCYLAGKTYEVMLLSNTVARIARECRVTKHGGKPTSSQLIELLFHQGTWH